MVNPIGRLEGMAKGLFNATAQTADLFIDIVHEGLTGADKFEGNGVLDTVWGSWQDNVLGEGGVIQSLFGPDEFDENGNPNAAFGGHFFGSIPETVRKPATNILNPAMEALDLVYEYGVDRPIGTFVTYANMVANDGIHTVVDTKSWEEAWQATGSRSWGQAFALLSKNIDLDNPDDVEKFEGTSYYNLVSGSVDLFSNWFLDPANLAAFGFAKIVKQARRTRNAKLLASGAALETRQYRVFKERLQEIKDTAIHSDKPDEFLNFSERYKSGQGFEQSDMLNIGILGARIKKAADKGRLGRLMSGVTSPELALSLAAQHGDGIDMFVTLLADSGGHAKVFEKLQTKAQTYIEDLWESGGLKDELALITRNVDDYLKVGPDGKPLTIDEYIKKLEDGLTDREGKALHPQRAQTAENLKFLRGMIDMEGKTLVDLFDGVVLGQRVTPGQVDRAQQAVVTNARKAADDLGLRFNPADASLADPVGEGFFRWFRTTTTDKAYLRDKPWIQLSDTDRNNLLHWAGIPVGDAIARDVFQKNWDELVQTDVALNDVIETARIGHRNKGGAYRPGDPEISQRLRDKGVGRMLDAMEEMLGDDPVKLPRRGLERSLLRKKGVLSTKRVRRGRRPMATDARVRGAPNLNATVTAAGNIQDNAWKRLWDDLNRQWTEEELATARMPGESDEFAKWKNLSEQQRVVELKKLLPKDLHPYIGLSIDEIIDRVPGGRDFDRPSYQTPDSPNWGRGKPTEAALAVIDEIYEALSRVGVKTRQAPKLDAEGNQIMRTVERPDPETGKIRKTEEPEFDEIPDEMAVARETQSAIPEFQRVVTRWAPPRQYRDTNDWYEDVNYRPYTHQLTPEDGLDPHWQKFIDDVETNRLNVSFEWVSRWGDIVADHPALAGGLKVRRSFDELSDEAQFELIDSFDPTLKDNPDFLTPKELKKVKDELADLKSKQSKVRGRRSQAQKDDIKNREAEIRDAETLLEGGRVGAKAFSELPKDRITAGSLRDEYRQWIDEATPEQFLELKQNVTGKTDITEAENAWAALSSQEQLKGFWDLANELAEAGVDLKTTFARTRRGSVLGRIDEYDDFVKYSEHWDEVLESKFGEAPTDFSDLRADEVGDIRVGANTIRELLAERHEIRRSDPGEYERPQLDEFGNQVINEAGTPVWQRSPYADEGIGGLQAQSAERAAYKFALRRPTLTPAEIPLVASLAFRRSQIDELKPENKKWYSKPGKEDIQVKIDPNDESLKVLDKATDEWVDLADHPEFNRPQDIWVPEKRVPGEPVVAGHFIADPNSPPITEGWIYENGWYQNGVPVDEIRLQQLEHVQNVVHNVRNPRAGSPTGRIFEALGDDELLRRQREIENKLMAEYPEMPFAAALVFEDHRLKNAARRKDFRDMQHENIEALYDALNSGNNRKLIEVVANDIIERHIPNVGALERVPGVSRFNELSGGISGGIGAVGRSFGEQGYVREFVHTFEKKSGFPIEMPSIRVRYFVEKVTQGLIHWDKPTDAYQQFERMLRDASRVRPRFYQNVDLVDKNLVEYAGLNSEEILGRWVANPDRQARQQLFNETVETLNVSLGKMFEGRIGQWKDGKFVNTSSTELTRILRRNWRSAQKELTRMGSEAKIYGNNQIRTFSMNENRVIDVRNLPLTPSQLAEATLIPRYDLYANAFTDQSKVMKAAQGVRDGVGMTLDVFTTLWKKSVLLRPAWPVRVLTDEFMRVSADYGTMTALKGVAGGLGDLRAGLFQREGFDLAGPLQIKMREVLNDAKIKIELPGSGLRPVRPEVANSDELLQAVTKHFDGDEKQLQDLVKEVIHEQYGKQKIRRRVMGASALGAWLAGPAGLVGAAMYGLYSRGSMQRLAKLETLNHMGFSLSQIGRHQVNDQILRIEKQLVKLDSVRDKEQIANLIEKAKNLEDGRSILLTQARQMQDQFTLRDRVTGQMRKKLEARKQKIDDASESIQAYGEGTIVQNFDTAGKIMVDAGISDFHLDGLSIGNAFGNTPQAVQINRNSMSANQYRSTLWNSTSAVTRKTIRQSSRQQYDILNLPGGVRDPKLFTDAWDDTVNHQWVPMQDPGAYSRPGHFAPRNETIEMADSRVKFNQIQEEFGIVVEKLNDKYGTLQWDDADLTPAELDEFVTLQRASWEASQQFEEAGKYWAGERGPVTVDAAGTVDIGKKQNEEAFADAKWWRENSGIAYSGGNPFQEFTRLFWLDNVTDDDILQWVSFGDGRALQDAMPAHFTDNVHSLEEWIRQVRYETNNLVPPLNEFRHVRAKMAQGDEVKWVRDIQPIVDRQFGGSVAQVRMSGDGFGDFGFVIGDSALEDAYKTSGMIVRIKRWTDNAFTHLGTMPTDLLTRSTVFRSVYSAEVARRIPNFKKSDGSYSLTQKDLNAIEGEARRIALGKTKDLLYDLAERTKFEELMANVMPFFAAYQEVITRWAGLSVRNPGFVLATTRNFHNGLENFNAVDEETGAPLFLLRFGTIIGAEVPSWLPLLGDQKVFGRFGKLGDNPIKLNLSSMSMMSGGLPGFGPLVAFAASEAAVQVPSVTESLDWAFPYGLAEGGNIFERFVDSSTPLWTQTARSAMFSTYERQRVRARVASDMIVEYELNGEAIESASDLADFEDEVDERVKAMMRLRMVANLMSPISFMYQSPHAHVISNYKKIMEEEGLHAADEWLLIENPDFWGVVGRQTRVTEGAVASATLFGEEQYQDNPKFFLDNLSILDLLIGKTGPTDVLIASDIAFSNTVYRKEIGEGRRTYQTPKETAERAAGNAGWFWYERGMQPIRQKQEQLRLSGLPSSLNAKANINLKQARQMIIQKIGNKFPLWKEQFNDIKTAEENSKVIHSLRNWVNNIEISGWHPGVTHVMAYLQKRDEITGDLLQRSQQSGDPEMQLLSHPGNKDKRDEWESARIAFSNVPDMASIFVRYLDQDDVIFRTSWPKNQKAYQIGVSRAA